MTDTRIASDDARRLKNDTSFMTFVAQVRDEQHRIFAASAPAEIADREDAHAILLALNLIECTLDAAIAAEAILDRRGRN